MGRGDDTAGDINAGLVLWEAWSAPLAVRTILAQWAAPCDAAPLLPRGTDPAPLQRCYRELAAGRGVDRAALALLHENAVQNRTFGLWSDLRAEAVSVLDWLAPLLAGSAPASAAARLTSPVRPAPPYTSPDSRAIA